jgi:hypothetical protein
MSYNYYRDTLVPSSSAWSVGTISHPFKDIWLSYGSVNLANQVSGVTGVALSNTTGNIQISRGGLNVISPTTGNTIFLVASGGQVTLTGALSTAEIEINPSCGVTFGDNTRQTTAYVEPPSGTYAAQISGTWTPQISAAGYALSAVKYSGGTPAGVYIKTGRYVYCTFNISVSAFTGVSNSANLYLVNLPFTVENGPLLMPFGDLSVYRYSGLTGGGQGITGGNEGTDQGFTLYNISPGSTVNLTPSIFSVPASMTGTLRYMSS